MHRCMLRARCIAAVSASAVPPAITTAASAAARATRVANRKQTLQRIRNVASSSHTRHNNRHNSNSNNNNDNDNNDNNDNNSQSQQLERGWRSVAGALARALDHTPQFERYQRAGVFSSHDSLLMHIRAFVMLHAPHWTRIDAFEFLAGAHQAIVMQLLAMHSLAFGEYMGGSVDTNVLACDNAATDTNTDTPSANTTDSNNSSANTSDARAMAQRLRCYCTLACYERVAHDVKLAHALRHVVVEMESAPTIERLHIRAVEYARLTPQQYEDEVSACVLRDVVPGEGGQRSRDDSIASSTSIGTTKGIDTKVDTLGSTHTPDTANTRHDAAANTAALSWLDDASVVSPLPLLWSPASATVERLRIVLDVETVETVNVHRLQRHNAAAASRLERQRNAYVWVFESRVTRPEDVDWRIAAIERVSSRVEVLS